MFDFYQKRKNIVVNGEKEITLRKICNVMGISVPKKFKGIQNEINNDIVFKLNKIRAGSFYFIFQDNVNIKKCMDDAVNYGAKVIFVDKNDFVRSGLKEEDYPCILLDDKLEEVGKLFSEIRNSYKAKVISITGTVGKTTTKSFIEAILSSKYNIFASPGNQNSFTHTGDYLLKKLNADLDIFIQEAGALNHNRVRKIGRMLEPDAFIILNVLHHHLDEYGTYENLFEDKTSIDDYIKPDGVVVANFDDEGIAEHTFKHQVISFGVDTKHDVDFRAINIIQNKELLEFDILHKMGTTHLRINILGTHNVYNALAAFALSKWIGLTDDEIMESFLAYRSVGIRQNFVNIGGNYLLLDCYNICEASIEATLDILENFSVEAGNKKIAILGGENGMSEEGKIKHREFGRKIAINPIDKIAVIAPKTKDKRAINQCGDSYTLFEGMKEGGCQDIEIFSDLDKLADYIQTNVNRGDIIAFKCIFRLYVTVAIDKAFGTGFSYEYKDYILNALKLTEGNFSGRVIEQFGEAELLKGNNIKRNLIIPETIGNYPLFRVGKAAFKNCKTIQTIEFGTSVKNIGAFAFANCTNLCNVTIPKNVKVIEERAFSNCVELESVILESGVTHIAQSAFENCKRLSQVYIPDTVGNIENAAFKNCEDLIIHCKERSFAEQYAKDNNIQYVLI